MSQAGSIDLTPAPLSPSTGSESGSLQTFRTWTIPRIIAQLRRKGIPYPATARKAELFRLLFPPTPNTAPSNPQTSLQSISGAISQLHSMVATLSATVSDVQTRVATLEARPLTPVHDTVVVSALASPLTGTPESSSTVIPAHLVSASLRKDILEGKDVNLASLLVSVHDVADNRAYAWGDVSVVVKSKDPRLSRKLTVTEFVLAFGMFRDIICSAAPNRREELDLYLHSVTDLGYKYGGHAFYDYHRSFSAKAAAKLSQFQAKTDWSICDTELFCRHFAGLRSPLCTLCQSSTHTANWCSDNSIKRPAYPPSSSTSQSLPGPSQQRQVDRLGRPIFFLGGAPICNNFNNAGCFHSQCRLLHVCTACHKAHPKTTCQLKQDSKA
ncbi:uncharacterized protein LOC120938098 [Rana temporaria]|uniref:uncharacterized protein LOC120938098 n=1 Tax=Rana temporaria TaxID=8407 RepID=UPI001AAD952A|nr:uncharacterized protein LOC120938098 [Rana temporaria]